MNLAGRRQGYYWGAALLCLAACKREGGTEAPAAAVADTAVAKADACKDAPALGWLEGVAKEPKSLEGAGGGWVAFYQRDYRGAAAKFAAASPDPLARAGEARAHLHLGQLYLSLARLTAKSQVAYFEARQALGAQVAPLSKGEYFRGVSSLLAGHEEDAQTVLSEVASAKRKAPAAYRGMARSLAGPCNPSFKAHSAWDQVANLVRCRQDLPVCPAKVGAAPAQDPWKTRIALYHAALCADPDTVDEARLTHVAQSPADTEVLQGKGGVSATMDYYDPLALWALAQVHLRKAEEVAAGDSGAQRLVRAWAAALRGNKAGAQAALQGLDAATVNGADPEFLLLSEVRSASQLKARVQALLGAPEAAPAADPAIAQMRLAEAADVAAVACVGGAPGQKVVGELGLARGFARSTLRESVLSMLDQEQTCEGALRSLRATQDIKNLESVSYVNEPRFLVKLAEAALCMRRSSEAIGTLRTVKDAYPEAEAALATAQGLSVVRLMGGTGGTQKIQ